MLLSLIAFDANAEMHIHCLWQITKVQVVRGKSDARGFETDGSWCRNEADYAMDDLLLFRSLSTNVLSASWIGDGNSVAAYYLRAVLSFLDCHCHMSLCSHMITGLQTVKAFTL